MQDVAKKLKMRKEYVFLSESGKFYIFQVTKKAGKTTVKMKRSDAAEMFDYKFIPKNDPGYVSWSYSMVKNLLNNWDFLGEL